MLSMCGEVVVAAAPFYRQLTGLLRLPHYTVARLDEALTLYQDSRAATVALADIAECSVTQGLFWPGVRVRTRSGPAYDVGGLSSRDANVLCGAVRARAALAFWASHRPSILQALDRWDALRLGERYVPRRDLDRWQSSFGAIPRLDASGLALDASSPSANEAAHAALARLLALQSGGDAEWGRGNARFETEETQRHAELFDRIESHPLTRLQRLAVVRNEDCGLVVAGAGSGKTSTLIARVAYLLESGLAEPREILLLTFGKGAARELRARVKKRLGATIEAGTFHSMGHAIIGAATGAVPRLCGEADDEKGADKPTQDMIESLCRRDARFAAATIVLAAYHRGAYTPHWEFQDQTEYERYIRRVERRTLSGARVRSYEECVIANWLTLKGIRYEYERPYEYRTASASRRQYQPDFYLPDHGVYIEHFGVSRAGDVAPGIDREQYLAGMEWKRELHRSRGTTLIQTYSWMHAEGVLFDTLERELRANGVRLTELDPDEALQALNKLGAVYQTAQLIVRFRGLAKGLGLSPSDLRSRARGFGDYGRSAAFLDVYEPLLAEYERENDEKGEIDYEDMLHQAADYLERCRYASPFRHIIVDEFQDVSAGEVRLAKALRDQVAEARLLCVGDDWQSIYRFRGADLGYMTSFAERFGHATRTDLDLTFRCNEAISAVASRFVQRNPAQLRKTIKSTRSAGPSPIVIRFATPEETRQQALRDVLDEIAAAYPEGASVFILGRYNQWSPTYGLPHRDEWRQFEREVPGLSLEFLTIHKAKGLEADVVVICDLVEGFRDLRGFPSSVEGDPLIQLPLPHPDPFPDAEERRLLYVAMTRARDRVYLMAELGPPSSFIMELSDAATYPEVTVRGESTRCPRCPSGFVRWCRAGAQTFIGCSDYPLCRRSQPALDAES
jgi:DNA helicase-4